MTTPAKPTNQHARAGLRFLTGIPGLPIRPTRTRAVREALHALAETPGLTLAEYEKRREAIEKGHQT